MNAATHGHPEQPPGIDPDYPEPGDRPDAYEAAQRLRAYIGLTGDGLYDVAEERWPVGETAPLYARDIAAVVECIEAYGPGHRIELREDGWTLGHPATCRVNLFGCPYNRARPEGLPVGVSPGTYECELVDGELVIGKVTG